MSPESAVVPPWRGMFQCQFFSHNLTVVAIALYPRMVWFEHPLNSIKYYNIMSLRGNDFRQAFSRIGGLRALTAVPFMALTDSAPPKTQDEICSSLHLHHHIVVARPLDKANVFLSQSDKSSTYSTHLHTPA